MVSESFAITGLGNPGAKYLKTRHNVGFMFLDWFADQHGVAYSSGKHQGLSGSIRANGMRLYLLKPQTFMNRSGRSVSSLVNFFNIDPAKLLVVHDDIDMHTGRIKLIEGGGTGGHNGIRSVVKELGTNKFYRLKIGVGRPGEGNTHPEMEVDKYVLADFSAEELNAVHLRFAEIADGLAYFFRGEVAQAMTLLNAIK